MRLPAEHPFPRAGQVVAVNLRAAGCPNRRRPDPRGATGAALAAGERLTGAATLADIPRCLAGQPNYGFGEGGFFR